MTTALAHRAIHRHALAGADDNHIAELDFRQRYVLVLSVAAHPRALRAQRIERANRLSGLMLGARFQPFAEQHQSNHRRRGLEVKMGLRMSGVCEKQINRKSIGSAGAKRHQQIHIAGVSLQRIPTGAIETRAQPELHRRGQRPLQPPRQHPMLTDQQAKHGS